MEHTDKIHEKEGEDVITSGCEKNEDEHDKGWK